MELYKKKENIYFKIMKIMILLFLKEIRKVNFILIYN
jgi:hypothetical protein